MFWAEACSYEVGFDHRHTRISLRHVRNLRISHIRNAERLRLQTDLLKNT